MLSHHIQLNGQPFHYLGWGKTGAPTLLFLHGFPEYSAAWAPLATRLADQYHCIAPDQRGYGQSWSPEAVEHYKTHLLVSDMTALIDHLGGGPVTVIGHDWGAAVAYGLAFRHPELVNRLIILNGVHPAPFQRAMAAGGAQTAASQYFHTLRRDGAETWLAENDFARLLTLFSAKMDTSWLSGDTLAAYKTEWARPGRLRGMINWYRAAPVRLGAPGEALTDLPPIPADKFKVAMPHLLIWGQNDTALLPVSTEGLEDYCADLTRIDIADADHWLVHQQPDRIAAEIRSWLA
ncbi:alpha/beta fold hydrolase [Thalassovita taeanensis]|uniref:Pimeloyl-ACP methyl ester carboxylesterase n=1 Tax=Thalassovita taeanensis TaxID=657014 RepID=A0A1H9EJ93_9RHOB|nr:alpha/beta hydrolase [Thalassovita taeanensis]SEQ25672.1 Pimeloyl-ACP methyl ester carboxylesterase [Thalassovita taeanensis]